MSNRSPRIGLSLFPSRDLPLDAIVDLARMAESLGYDSLWLPETWGEDAVAVLASLAVRTTTLRLASGVLNVYSRSASLIAQAAATLQDLSGGRFILGLGTSGPRVIEDWHGIPYRHPLARTLDYVEIVRLALRGERVDYRGSEVQVEGFRLLNPPRTPVPIYIAAMGPRNVQLTARIADGWLPIFVARGHLAPLLDDFHRAAREAGRDPAVLSVAAYLPTLAGPDADRLLARHIAYYVGGMGTFYAAFLTRLGFAQQVNRIRELWDAGERPSAIRVVGDDLLATCTVRTREDLAGYLSEGMDLPILAIPRGVSPAQAAQTVELFGPA